MHFHNIFRSNLQIHIVVKEGKLPNPKKIQALMNIRVSTNPQQIHVFNYMAQFYQCFIKDFMFIVAPITKLILEQIHHRMNKHNRKRQYLQLYTCQQNSKVVVFFLTSNRFNKRGFGEQKMSSQSIEFITMSQILHDLEQSTQELEHEQMTKLVLFPSQPPPINVPFKREIHILDS